jgi:hypothetical protein
VRALFFAEHEIRDGRTDRHGNHRIVSRRIQFVETGEDNAASGGGAAPYLDYRPPTEDEQTALAGLLEAPWLQEDIEGAATAYAIERLVPEHFDEVKSYREGLVLKTMAAVKDRLTKEIQYWDNRAEELKLEELAGKQPRLNSAQAGRRCDELTDRLQNRMKELELERQLAPLPPVISGGALIVPERVLASKSGRDYPGVDKASRDRIEELAMQAVEEAEKRMGRVPRRMPQNNPGYDIESLDPESGHLHFIEVKGRSEDASFVHVTKTEVLLGLNRRKFSALAIVLVGSDGVIGRPHYVRDAMSRVMPRDVPFGMTGIDLSIKELLEMESPEVI